ncbi:disintegrin and metallo ase domain-containing 19 isoform X1, partial [Paramuricea clavata]
MLILETYRGLFSPQFEEHYVSNDAPELARQIPHEHCFYHGTVKGEENSVVSLSTCDGIEGVIRTDDDTFYIHPLKSQDGQ